MKSFVPSGMNSKSLGGQICLRCGAAQIMHLGYTNCFGSSNVPPVRYPLLISKDTELLVQFNYFYFAHFRLLGDDKCLKWL